MPAETATATATQTTAATTPAASAAASPATAVVENAAASAAAAATATSTTTAATEPEYKFDAMEGVPPELDAAVIESAKLAKLSPEQAKALREYEAKSFLKAAADDKTAATKRDADKATAKAQMVADWDAKNAAHPEFGGAKATETDAKITKLLAQFDTDGTLKKEIDAAPEILKHPAFRTFFARLAYASGEGKFVPGSAAAPAKVPDHELFYPKK